MSRPRGSGVVVALALASLIGCRSTAPAAERAGACWDVIGASVEGRELLATTVGTGPLRVYWLGGIHGDEPEGGRELAALVARLLEPSIAARCTVRVLADANPDGTAHGTRGNARGVDLNRNLPAANFRGSSRRGTEPLSEPETRALWTDLEAFGAALVVAVHSSSRGPFVNYDGPAADLAAAFASGARAVDPRWHVVPDMGYATPGSLGTAVGVDRGVPILTLEFERGGDADHVRAALLAGVGALLTAHHRAPSAHR